VTDLISAAVGGRVVAVNDEFFAEAVSLLNPAGPVWKEGEYTDRGKWMDGWETRRRREPGHDWCVIALGIPGRVKTVRMDTSYFTGNYPEAFSLEGCGVGSDDRLEEAVWVELIGKTPLTGDALVEFGVDDPHRVTHLRLNIFPDGGVARLRVEGDPIPAKDHVCPDQGRVDLVSSLVGGEALEASDLHYSPPSNMLRPTDPAGMWDGWETRRRRGPGHDWASFRLGLPGVIESVEIDTRHFKGNAPGWVSVQLSDDGESWHEVVTRAAVDPDTVNTVPLVGGARAGFLRLDVHPDGGVARLRLWGIPDPQTVESRRLEYLNALFDFEARRLFGAACGAPIWVGAMVAARPFASVEVVLTTADARFDLMGESDWLEAFASHPRIGERGDALAEREQAGTAAAPDPVLKALSEVNAAYEDRYRFTYIVYATGKTAEEMLEIARERLGNTREREIQIASEQQRAITRTRLRRMLCNGAAE